MDVETAMRATHCTGCGKRLKKGAFRFHNDKGVFCPWCNAGIERPKDI